MTPYRTASPRHPLRDADVARFAELARGWRRTQQALSLVMPTLLFALLYAPLGMQPCKGRSATAATTLVPFGSTPRRMPPLRVLVRRPCPPMEDAERVQYEQGCGVECTDGCLWYPERSSWR
jgi:hypothetical protein